MGIHRTEALVLRTYPLREADQIVVFYSPDAGQRRGVARGSRRVRSRMCGALEPLRLSQLIYFEKEGRELVRIDAAEVSERFPHLECSFDLMVHGLHLLELLLRTTTAESPSPPLFRLILKALRLLDRGAADPGLVRAYCEHHILRLMGYGPDLVACETCRRPFGDQVASFDLELGRLDCPRCRRTRAAGPTIGAAGRKLLLSFNSHPITRLGELPYPDAVAAELRRFLPRLFDYRFESLSKVDRFLSSISHFPPR